MILIKFWASSPERCSTTSIWFLSEKMIVIRDIRSFVVRVRLINRFQAGGFE